MLMKLMGNHICEVQSAVSASVAWTSQQCHSYFKSLNFVVLGQIILLYTNRRSYIGCHAAPSHSPWVTLKVKVKVTHILRGGRCYVIHIFAGSILLITGRISHKRIGRCEGLSIVFLGMKLCTSWKQSGIKYRKATDPLSWPAYICKYYRISSGSDVGRGGALWDFGRHKPVSAAVSYSQHTEPEVVQTGQRGGLARRPVFCKTSSLTLFDGLQSSPAASIRKWQ